MLTRIGLAVVLVMGALGSSPKARADNPARPPVATALNNGELLDQAVAKGKLLLAKAKWSANLKGNPYRIYVLGDAIYGEDSSDPNMTSVPTRNCFMVELRTGGLLWNESVRNVPAPDALTAHYGSFSPPVESTDLGLEVFDQVTPGQLTLKRRAKDTGTLTELWKGKLGDDKPIQVKGYGVLSLAGFAGKQVIVGGTYVPAPFVGSEPGDAPMITPMAIRSLDRQSGKEQWATPLEGGAVYTSQPLLEGQAVYVTVDQSKYPMQPMPIGPSDQPKSYVLALNAADGKVLWRAPALETRQSAPVVHGNLVITSTEKGQVIACDTASGKEVWRETISPHANPARSTIESMEVELSPLFIDGSQLIVPVNPPFEPIPASPHGQSLDVLMDESIDRTVGAFAVFDLQTGKQIGYFGGFWKQVRRYFWRGWSPTTIVGVHKDTIFAFVKSPLDGDRWRNGLLQPNAVSEIGEWCIGVNRKTLELECFIPARSQPVIEGDVLYVVGQSREGRGYTISALPLAAWDEVKGGK